MDFLQDIPEQTRQIVTKILNMKGLPVATKLELLEESNLDPGSIVQIEEFLRESAGGENPVDPLQTPEPTENELENPVQEIVFAAEQPTVTESEEKKNIQHDKSRRGNVTDYAIGIDLGTTYSCVGVVKDGKVKIIHNDCGLTTTASFVAFTETERLIGDPAKSQGIKNFQNTVFDVKRLIGRKFENKTIQDDIKQLPFKVVEVHGRCGVEVQFKGKTKIYSTEELSAMVLTKMKETAEAFLRQPVKNAVITVPAYFNGTQRQATKDAAAIAGLNVLQIINEPTAAGIAYGLDVKTPKKQNILVYDLGEGTFDVTVMNFDSCLVDYCVADIKKNYKVDITTNKRALRKVRKACEAAKRILSYQMQTTIEIDGLINGEDVDLDIDRGRFEELCSHLFRKTLECVDRGLAYAKMTKENIDEIILVGGTSRIPGIKRLLMEYFKGKELNDTVDQDEAVAYGAAIQAAVLAGNTTDLVRNARIRDVTPCRVT